MLFTFLCGMFVGMCIALAAVLLGRWASDKGYQQRQIDLIEKWREAWVKAQLRQKRQERGGG